MEGWGLRDDGEALMGDSWSISGLMSSLSSLPTATRNTKNELIKLIKLRIELSVGHSGLWIVMIGNCKQQFNES